MGVGTGLYMYDVVKSSRSLSHLLMSSCIIRWNHWYQARSNISAAQETRTYMYVLQDCILVDADLTTAAK